MKGFSRESEPISEPFKQPLFRLMVSHTVPTRDRVSFLSADYFLTDGLCLPTK